MDEDEILRSSWNPIGSYRTVHSISYERATTRPTEEATHSLNRQHPFITTSSNKNVRNRPVYEAEQPTRVRGMFVNPAHPYANSARPYATTFHPSRNPIHLHGSTNHHDPAPARANTPLRQSQQLTAGMERQGTATAPGPARRQPCPGPSFLQGMKDMARSSLDVLHTVQKFKETTDAAYEKMRDAGDVVETYQKKASKVLENWEKALADADKKARKKKATQGFVTADTRDFYSGPGNPGPTDTGMGILQLLGGKPTKFSSSRSSKKSSKSKLSKGKGRKSTTPKAKGRRGRRGGSTPARVENVVGKHDQDFLNNNRNEAPQKPLTPPSWSIQQQRHHYNTAPPPQIQQDYSSNYSTTGGAQEHEGTPIYTNYHHQHQKQRTRPYTTHHASEPAAAQPSQNYQTLHLTSPPPAPPLSQTQTMEDPEHVQPTTEEQDFDPEPHQLLLEHNSIEDEGGNENDDDANENEGEESEGNSDPEPSNSSPHRLRPRVGRLQRTPATATNPVQPTNIVPTTKVEKITKKSPKKGGRSKVKGKRGAKKSTGKKSKKGRKRGPPSAASHLNAAPQNLDYQPRSKKQRTNLLSL